MKIIFYHTPESREKRLAEAFASGVRALGDECTLFGEKYQGVPDAETDVAVLIGVKGRSRLILDTHRQASKHVVYLDKAFFRACSGDYFKASVDDFQPLDYLMKSNKPWDRWDHLSKRYGLRVLNRALCDGPLVYLGPSQKYARFHHLGDATEYAMSVLSRARQYTDREFIYRPKASWSGAVPIPGATFSRPPRELSDDLLTASALVVHGSNASADALLAGIPIISLGPSIAHNLAHWSLSAVEQLECPPAGLRSAWAKQVAYCQWTIPELKSGEAWSEMRPMCLNSL